MLILDVNKVSLNYGYGKLFNNLQFSLNQGEKISVVGPNGCGKTTLLKMIAGLEKSDEGSISIKKDAKIVYLDQVAPDKSDDRVVNDILKDVYRDLLKIKDEMESLLRKLENNIESEQYEKNLNRYCILQEKFDRYSGYNIDKNVETVCNGLSISKEKRLANYNSLSGGERAIIHMAKALLQNPDLLLLDEPTNHFDIERIEWLEKYIKNFNGAVVVVSHDREFLDKISDKILDLENGEGMIYHTNYSEFLEEKKNVHQKKLAEYKTQQKHFEKLEKQAKRFAEAGKATNSTVIAKKASVMFNRLEREKEKTQINRPIQSKKVKINFSNIQGIGKRAIEIKDLSISYKNHQIIKKVNFYIRHGEHIAIVGKNGSGKSSIIKTIVNEQKLSYQGEIYIAQTVKIGYIPQIIKFDDDEMNICEYIKHQLGFNEEKARSLLARFLFKSNDMYKRVGNLSGGERIRLQLAILLENNINTLIFDEPTNHIDIPTKESLEEAIDNFEGTVIAVSHDRFFINKFANRILEVKEGTVKEFIGNYDDYLETTNS